MFTTTQGGRMFTQLTDDLLDLTATEKGFGGALYAVNEEPGCSSSSGPCIVLCTLICSLCFF